MKILAIGSHFDDIELGCGGTLLKHKNKGDTIELLVITESGYKELSGRERNGNTAKEEAQEIAKYLGAGLKTLGLPTLQVKNDSTLIFAIQKIVKEFNPDYIYTHFPFDQHTDHSAVGNASIIAGRSAKKLLFYRSNFNKPLQPFVSNYVVDISNFIEEKIKLLSFYKSEYPKIERWIKMFKAQAQIDGLTHGFDYAETFMLFLDKEF